METCISLLFLFSLPHVVVSFPKTAEQRLLDYLFHNRSADVRPVINTSTALDVKFGIELVQLLQLDERSQCITTKLWARQEWTNELMRWEPKEWEGVNVLNVEAADVWKPDIVLYNNAEESFGGGIHKYKAMINLFPDGRNTWLSPTTFKSTCKIDVQSFPFDEQRCQLKFGPWSYDSSKVNLSRHYAPPTSKQYLNSSTWELLDIEVEFNSIVYNCCPTPYQDLTFRFVFRRQPLYFVFNLIAPCIVLVSMILFSFWLPPESGERLSLNITVLLALAVFLQFLSNTLPRNSDSKPILSVFFITMMSECAVALIATVIVLAVHHHGEDNNAKSPPLWAKKFFFRHETSGTRRRKMYNPVRLQEAIRDIHNKWDGRDIKDDSLLVHSGSVKIMKGFEESLKWMAVSKQDDGIKSSLQDISKEVHKISEAVTSQEKQDFVAQEWRRLAKDLDRLFFIIFLIIFVLSGAGTLLQVYTFKYTDKHSE